MCEKVIIRGWGIEPGFDFKTGKLDHVRLDFSAGECQIDEILVHINLLNDEDPRIVFHDEDGKTMIGFCLKPVGEEEKYGSWLSINLTDRHEELAMLQDWLAR